MLSRNGGMALILSFACLSMLSNGARADDALKVVVHVNFAEPDRQGAGLKNINNILKNAPDTQVVVVCHGLGIGLVVDSGSSHGATVAELIERGVKFLACENTMREKSIAKENLLPGVGTVPAGAVEVIRRQQKDGYAYFKP